jgi:hypothetical protein
MGCTIWIDRAGCSCSAETGNDSDGSYNKINRRSRIYYTSNGKSQVSGEAIADRTHGSSELARYDFGRRLRRFLFESDFTSECGGLTFKSGFTSECGGLTFKSGFTSECELTFESHFTFESDSASGLSGCVSMHRRSPGTQWTCSVGCIHHFHNLELDGRRSSGQLLDQLVQCLRQHNQRLCSIFEQPARFRSDGYQLLRQRPHRVFHVLLPGRSRRRSRRIGCLQSGQRDRLGGAEYGCRPHPIHSAGEPIRNHRYNGNIYGNSQIRSTLKYWDPTSARALFPG